LSSRPTTTTWPGDAVDHPAVVGGVELFHQAAGKKVDGDGVGGRAGGLGEGQTGAVVAVAVVIAQGGGSRTHVSIYSHKGLQRFTECLPNILFSVRQTTQTKILLLIIQLVLRNG
jgi:hypothetical protein